MLEAVIFDVDGTLSNNERDGHRVAFNQAFADAGLDWHWSVELYGELLAVTGGKERIGYYLDKYNAEFKRPDDLAGLIARLHANKTQHYQHLLSQGGIPLRTGVPRLLRELRRAGMRMAIATTTSRINVDTLLTNTLGKESIGWFEVIGAGEHVVSKKPAPDVYLYVLDKLELRPDRCLVIEDSGIGLRSAISAGISAVLVTTNYYTSEDDFNGATMVVNHLGEPDQPFDCVRGCPPDVTCVDLDLLKTLRS